MRPAATWSLAAVLWAVGAGGCGTRGPRGPSGDPGGPAPHLTSIDPSAGSSHTLFTVRGEELGEDLDKLTVWFDGREATVVSATSGRLVVTGGFEPVDESIAVSVTVERDGRLSNALAVTAHPDGSVRPWGGAAKVFGTPDSIAVVGTGLHVVDSDRGLFTQDLGNGAITTRARNDRDGFGALQGVFAGPGGALYASDQVELGANRLFRLDPDGWRLVAQLSQPLVAMPYDPDGRLYLVYATTVQRLLANGNLDGTFSATLPAAAGGAVFQAGLLFVSIPTQNKIVKVASDTGAVTNHATLAMNLPRAMDGDGTNLYVADTTGLLHVDAGGTVSVYSTVDLDPLAYDDVRQLVRRSGGELVLSQPDQRLVLQLEGQASGSVLASGIVQATALVYAGEELLVTDTGLGCWETPAGTPQGVVLALLRDGSVRRVTTQACVRSGLSPAGEGFAAFTDSPTSRVARIDLATGSVTVLADADDGIRVPLAVDADGGGNLFVADFDTTETVGAITRIAANGGVTRDFALSTGTVPNSLRISGDEIYMTDSADGGVFSVPVVSGGPFQSVVTAAAFPISYTGGLSPDGAGGIYLSDFILSGQVHHVSADGDLRSVTSITSSDFRPGALAYDPSTGDVLFGNEGSAEEFLGAVMP